MGSVWLAPYGSLGVVVSPLEGRPPPCRGGLARLRRLTHNRGRKPITPGLETLGHQEIGGSKPLPGTTFPHTARQRTTRRTPYPSSTPAGSGQLGWRGVQVRLLPCPYLLRCRDFNRLERLGQALLSFRRDLSS